jgi:2-amino-4-hydroxy-6-hydroxymethyldihydropteridine diphosphokinase
MIDYYLIGLGSNIEPKSNLISACKTISQSVEVLQCSQVLINPPCGRTFHYPFHNQLIIVRSDKSVTQLKLLFEAIEIAQGREPKCPARKLKDRPIDIDILIKANSIHDLLQQELDESYNQQIMKEWLFTDEATGSHIKASH